MKLLTTIYSKGENYAANIIEDADSSVHGAPSLFFFGDMDNDVDGSPYWHNDPYGQSGTSLLYKGKPLNGDIIPFIVVPPEIINVVKPVVLGCAGIVIYNGITCAVVVGDLGPRSKIGEGSPATLRTLGLPALHNGNGGLDTQEIFYQIWPGIPAVLTINGVKYEFNLSPS